MGWCPVRIRRKGTFFAVVGFPSRNGVTIKILYELHVLLHWAASTPSFTTGLIRAESKPVNQILLT